MALSYSEDENGNPNGPEPIKMPPLLILKMPEYQQFFFSGIDTKNLVLEVPLDMIMPWYLSPRHRFIQEELTSLAESLLQHGLLHPIRVRRFSWQYQDAQGLEKILYGFVVVNGHRRYEAAKIAGLRKIRVEVLDDDDSNDREYLIQNLTENLMRSDLSPIEKARGFILLTRTGMSQAAIATEFNLGRTGVSNLVRLLMLPEEVQDLIDSNGLSAGHGEVLLKYLDSPEDGGGNTQAIIDLAKQAVPTGDGRAMSVRNLEMALEARYPRRMTTEEPTLEMEAVDQSPAAYVPPASLPTPVIYPATALTPLTNPALTTEGAVLYETVPHAPDNAQDVPLLAQSEASSSVPAGGAEHAGLETLDEGQDESDEAQTDPVATTRAYTPAWAEVHPHVTEGAALVRKAIGQDLNNLTPTGRAILHVLFPGESIHAPGVALTLPLMTQVLYMLRNGAIQESSLSPKLSADMRMIEEAAKASK